MARRRSLPVLDTPAASPANNATLENARRKLGGPYEAPVGLVLGAAYWVDQRIGVVLASTTTFAELWVGAGQVKRVRREGLQVYTDPLPPLLAEVANDALAFARLEVGTTVAFRSADGTVQEGVLLEKCRFGALVARADGGILALGFRRLGTLKRLWN